MTMDVKNFEISGNYSPSESEPFMSPLQKEYFRMKLIQWRKDLLQESLCTLQHLQEDSRYEPDPADRASFEEGLSIELKARDRERKLIMKIDEALQRLKDGSYGYCEETGEPIGIRRLNARPIATLSLEAQEKHERQERVYRHD